jgi:hypothetical protein
VAFAVESRWDTYQDERADANGSRDAPLVLTLVAGVRAAPLVLQNLASG